ncbi:MAG: hypothetical protein DDT42_01769 [candidate division WS2 bacterium]|uniref:Uncharacterized protein n=1 Tax=Psychracetigena formicireducens TaxID=2986056 RepID=A0A9E2BI06_PSYF1|nr:hypothetical protein [Candidatus Psychracetigena formicireducens]
MATLLRQMPIEFEPRKKNRFFIVFPTEIGIADWEVQTMKAPNLVINEVEIPYFNTSTWVIGRGVWQAMDVTLVDNLGPSTSVKVQEWVRLHHETVTGRQGYAAGYKKNVSFKIADPTGVPVSEWLLLNCMITNVDYGDYDYGDDALAMISMTLRPDQCVLLY